MRHKGFGTEEYNTNQLQTEETTHTKQDQQEEHKDFCTEGFYTNNLQKEETTHTDHPQTEKTTRTKHDQQAKIEDICAEEFDTNQLKKEEKINALLQRTRLEVPRLAVRRWRAVSADAKADKHHKHLDELVKLRKLAERDTG